MRIVSPFHDFYDGGMAYGADPAQTWVRKPETIVGNCGDMPADAEFLNPRCGTTSLDGVTALPFHVVVAGRIYAGARVVARSSEGKAQASTCAYTFAKHQAWVARHGKTPTKVNRALRNHASRGLLRHFEQADVLTQQHRDWLTACPYPVLICGGNPWLLANGSLSLVEFYHVLGADETYQEIAMWLSGRAAEGPAVASITDSVRLQQHGFDKFSFRKPPSKR